jgi:hypothetical protein
MKKSFYLVALVLCLFGNVACADYLDKLLNLHPKYKSKVGLSGSVTTPTKKLAIFDISSSGSVRSDKFYRGKIVNKKRIFDSTNWEQEGGDKKEEALNKIQMTEDKLHYVEVKIKSYGSHRKALLIALRYNLPNLGDLIDSYVDTFFK